MNYIKLDKEDLYLVASNDELYFEYEGLKVAEILDNSEVRYLTKLPRGYKKGIENFILGIQCGTIDIIINQI